MFAAAVVAGMGAGSYATAQQDAVTPSEWADIYAQVAVLEAAFVNCLSNSHWVGTPGVIPPACRSVSDLKESGFLATDSVLPTVCIEKSPTDRPGYTAWMFVHQRWCDRGAICPGLIERFKEDRAKLDFAAAVDKVKMELSGNGLSLPDDERLFAAVLAGEISDVQFGEALCTTKGKALPRPPTQPAIPQGAPHATDRPDVNFPVPMNGGVGNITWLSDLVAMTATVTKQLYIRTVGNALADGTYVATEGGYAYDENGTVYNIAWAYEVTCTPQCRPNGAQHAYFNVAQGHTYVFMIQGSGYSNSGSDTPTYTFQHH